MHLKGSLPYCCIYVYILLYVSACACNSYGWKILENILCKFWIHSDSHFNFLGVSFVMVFSALLEYAAVGYISKRMQLVVKKKRTRSIISFPFHQPFWHYSWNEQMLILPILPTYFNPLSSEPEASNGLNVVIRNA